eukprot:147729-Amphidinium_carterae.2
MPPMNFQTEIGNCCNTPISSNMVSCKVSTGSKRGSLSNVHISGSGRNETRERVAARCNVSPCSFWALDVSYDETSPSS